MNATVKLSIIDRWRQRRILKRLSKVEKSRWLEIEHTLNTWKWPPEFYSLIPSWWNYKKIPEKAFVFIKPIMATIKEEFTEREELRFHNVHKGGMSEKEFEYWYENLSRSKSGKNGDFAEYSKYFDKKRFMENVEWWEDDVFEKIKTALKD